MPRVQLEADSRPIQRAERELRQLNQTGARTEGVTNRMTTSFKALSGVLAGLGVMRAWNTVLSNTIEQERVTAQLEATLRSTGRYTPELSRALQDYAGSLQDVTSFGDEAIISAQALLLTFTQVGEEAFPRAQEAILDVATAMGTDLRSATQQVGRALNGPIAGLSALSRSGIQFSDIQRENIRNFVEMGDMASAQAVILSELETQFGGSARAARNTLGGAIQSLKNAFGDLLEGDVQGGGVNGAVESINNLTQTLNDPAVVQGFQNLVQGAFGVAGAMATSIGAIQRFSQGLGDALFGGDALTEAKRNIGALELEIARLEQYAERPLLARLNGFSSVADVERELAGARTELEIWQRTAEQLADNSEQAAEKTAQLSAEVARLEMESAKAAERQKQFEEVTGSLSSEIERLTYEIMGESEAYEIVSTLRQLDIDLMSDEGDQIAALIMRRNELTDAIDRQATALSEFEQMQSQLDMRSMDAQDRLEYEFSQRLDIIQRAYDEEQITQEQARDAQLLALTEFERRKTEIVEQEENARLRVQQAVMQQQLGLTQSVLGNIVSVVEQAKGRESSAYQLAYIAQQGAAMGQAFINTESAAISALAPPPVGLGPVAGLPYSQTIRALGYASIAAMGAQTFQNLSPRRNGGSFSAGQNLLVGEAGPEVIRMPQGGRVTPYNDLMREAKGGSQTTTNNINLSFSVQAIDSVGVEQVLIDQRDTIFNVVADAMRRQGREL